MRNTTPEPLRVCGDDERIGARAGGAGGAWRVGGAEVRPEDGDAGRCAGRGAAGVGAAATGAGGFGAATAGAGAAAATGVGAAAALGAAGVGAGAAAAGGAATGAGVGAGAGAGAGFSATGAAGTSAAIRRLPRFSTTTTLVRPWLKLWRTVPCSTRGFSVKVLEGTLSVLSPGDFVSTIQQS